MCRSKHPFFLYKMKAPKSLVEVDTHTHAHAKRQLNYTSQFILIRKQTEQTRNEAKSSIWSTSQFALRSAALYVKLSSQCPRSQQQPPAVAGYTTATARVTETSMGGGWVTTTSMAGVGDGGSGQQNSKVGNGAGKVISVGHDSV